MSVPSMKVIPAALRAQTHKLSQELLGMGFELLERPPTAEIRQKVLVAAWELLDKRISDVRDWRGASSSLEEQATALLKATLTGVDLTAELKAIPDRGTGSILRDTLRAVEEQLKAEGLL